MKKKRTNKVSCERARAFPIERALAKLGHFPTMTNEKEAWFLSPFRSETQASFKVSKKLNRWYDHGAGKGGNVIDLICLIREGTVMETLKFIGEELSSFSFQPQPILRKEVDIDEKVIITKIGTLAHPALLGYIKSRAINIQIAKKYVKEVHYTFNGKPYFAIGLKNDSGGWELRNKYLKSCTSPKDITMIQNGRDKLTITEGMFDFLSIVGHRPELQQQTDFLVMNSTAFVSKAMEIMKDYLQIDLYLDNDSNGRRTTQKMMASSNNCLDRSMLYEGSKDMNEWLVKNTKNGFGQEARDVSLLPQRQTRFTPDGRKVREK